MKLTKASLIKLMSNDLTKLGYIEFRDTISGADGLFIKKVKSGFFLSLGLNKSRLYSCRFTGELYLSKTTTWSAVWGDMPRNLYIRVGHHLTNKERKLYLDEDYQIVNGDAWWQADREGDIQKFLESLKITEERMLAQADLFKKIDDSREIKELAEQGEEVFEILKNGLPKVMHYNFIPEKEIDGIPMSWFKAAEIVLKKEGKILSKNNVKGVAADAWRQNALNQSGAGVSSKIINK